jgi:hypothetical protein
MRAFTLIGAQLIAHSQQNDFGVCNPDLKAPVFGHIGETSNAVQCHGGSPDRRFT